MSKDKYLGWVYTRTGLAIGYVCDTAMICMFTWLLYRNMELHRTGFVWMSATFIAFGIFGLIQTFTRAKRREENLDFINANKPAQKQLNASLKDQKVDTSWLYIGILYPIAMALLLYGLVFSKRGGVQMYLGCGLGLACIAAYHLLRARYVKRR